MTSSNSAAASTSQTLPDTGQGTDPFMLYVATNLTAWSTETPDYYAQDVSVNGIRFRRLDPRYYAWLRHKMTLAKNAVQAGHIDVHIFDNLRVRFNALHAWAMDRYGKEVLLKAVNSSDPKTYRVPSSIAITENRVTGAQEQSFPEYLFPADGDWRFVQPVSLEAVAMVDRIRDEALALKWNEARLYQNRGRLRFPHGDDYGLVCFLGGGREIGDITREAIEIICPMARKGSLRFFNTGIEQRWMKRTAA